jgi:hypothetical protein
MRTILPAPLHGWRAFLGEVGVIVLGVLIALAFGLLVDAVNERRHAEAGQEAIRREIAESLAKLAKRARTEACIAQKLNAIDAFVERARHGGTTTPLRWIGRPQVWIMDDAVWNAASQSGRIALLPSDVQSSLSTIRRALRTAGETMIQEQNWWAQLRAIEGETEIDSSAVLPIRSLVSQARYADFRIRQSTRDARAGAEDLGIQPIDTQPDAPGTQAACVPTDTPRSEANRLSQNPDGEP